MAMRFYGWDVGGAHLKWVCLERNGALRGCGQIATALWQGIDVLEDTLRGFAFPTEACHAATFTGELADIFGNRREGLRILIDAVRACLPQSHGLWLYSSKNGFLPIDAAPEHSADLMSSNWHATAQWVAKRIPDAVLLDVGSTSADLVPILGGEPVPKGMDDQTRLSNGELVYTGIIRTPVMAVAQRVPWRGSWQGMMNELFATMADVYRIRGELGAGNDLHPAADGGAQDLPGSFMRLARMLGVDCGEGDECDLSRLADYLAGCQLRQLERALAQLISSHPERFAESSTIIATGSGAFLAERLARLQGWHSLRLSQIPAPNRRDSGTLDHSAPAYAVADLLREEMI
ncbi:MAG: hydantoinase/oxoprolinase family protein [Candidatus Eutrophobiaceae bacterium]